MKARAIETTIHTDVAIVGKGISGLALSLLLKRNKVKHLLLDRRDTGPAIALGETLPPSALSLLDTLDLRELFESHALQRTYGYHSIWGASRLQTDHFFRHNPYKYGLKIDRKALIAALERQIAGNVRHFDRLADVEVGENGCRVVIGENGEQVELRSKLLVDATGRKRAVLKQIGIGSDTFDDIIAFSCHLPKRRPSGLIHGVLVEAFSQGWGIASSLDAETQVMSLFTRRKSDLAGQLRAYSNWTGALSQTLALKDFLSEGMAVKVRGGEANSSKAARLAGKHWLAVGDAAIAFDPLSSHGISNALYCAGRAAAAIQAWLDGRAKALETYSQTLSGIFKGYLQQKNSLYAREKRWPESDFWIKQSAGISQKVV